MLFYLQFFLITCSFKLVTSDPHASLTFDYPNRHDGIYDQPVNLMTKKAPHSKSIETVPRGADRAFQASSPGEEPLASGIHGGALWDQTNEPAELQGDSGLDSWAPFDFSKFDQFVNGYNQDSSPEHNRIKRRARRRRGRGGKRRSRQRSTTSQPEDDSKNGTTTDVPIARSGKDKARNRDLSNIKIPRFDMYDPGLKDWESQYVEMPKDLYQAHLRPGVIFRIHMSEAVLKMQYRNYGEDKDESVIEADVEYLRLTRKVINDEITKFEDLQWLIGWFHNRSDLIQEHMCNTRYYTVGIPPTMFTHTEEYMKRMCLFDSVYIDHIPYVVGEDSSIMAAVAPPVLHCDAATCTSVPFIDSVMFDERFSRTNVRTLTRCQASCRAHCRNDPDCLKRCSDRCLRTD